MEYGDIFGDESQLSEPNESRSQPQDLAARKRWNRSCYVWFDGSTLEISPIPSIGNLQVPITEILYQGMESDAPDWAKTITDSDLNA